MSEILQVSQEFLKIGGNKQLGALLLAKVETLMERYKTSKFLTQPEMFELNDIIKGSTNLDIKVEYVPTRELVFGILVPGFNGHSGTTARRSGAPISLKSREMQEKVLKSTVDLEKAQVTGEFTKVPFTMLIPEKVFTGRYTAEEVTAGILHEIGHAFFTLATIGEYTWLNYYLTDGMEVLLGKKPNKYRVDLLNYDYLENQITDQKQREKLIADPSEKNLRRAILEVCHKQPRNHMTNQVTRGAIKRDEQLADVFAMRMGFSRHLATFIDKISREGPAGKRYARKRGMFVTMEIVKLLKNIIVGTLGAVFTIHTLGLSGIFALFYIIGNSIDGDFDKDYDNPTERIVKMRREVVTQIKDAGTSPTEKLALDEDLKVIDQLLDKRNQFESVWESLGYMIAPRARREKHRLKHEELLESLLANDLFVQANRFNQHT